MLTLRIAWRNVWRQPRRAGVVITGVAIGIAGVVLSMAVNFGMVVQMIETAIATDLGHIQIHAAGFDENPEISRRLLEGGRTGVAAVEGLSGVRAFARRIRGEGLLTSPRASAGVRVLGIEPEREARVSRIASSITTGDYLDGKGRRVLLGEALARRLQVEVGDKVVLSVQDLAGDLAGEALRVGGLFRTASSALDRSTVFVRFADGQQLFGLDDAISEIVVLAESRDEITEMRDALAADLVGFEVRSWQELQPALSYLVDLFDEQAVWVYVAVFVAMAFGIANVLMMAIYERMREIGILMAIGMSRARVVAMIVVEAALLTGVGLVIGFAIAVGAVAALSDGIDLSRYAEGLTAFGIGTRLVPVLRFADFATPTVVAIVTALVASAWPALRTVRMRPADAVRQT